ncbi:MAG TPA: DinB family protein [Candidatus Angelobacter sp.]|nr:DinB family protein [Candidatus Angelobacter sp.]
MKNLRIICLLLTLSVGIVAMSQGAGSSQGAKPATAAPQAQASSQPAPTLAGMIERQVTASEKQLVDAAEAMPEDKYDFSPESLKIPGSDYKGVRTFAMEVKHVATANFLFWTSITGDPMPAGIKGPNGPDDLKTKADIVKFLKDSYAVGHKAAATVTTENIMEQLTFRNNKAPRLYLATFPVTHANDHYGQMVEYLRMNGLVPPASRANN